ncbi:MAG: hypothetical protein JWR87_3130 [Segetibacter sp.]|jgi:hypothetical protein|nr:hypothetical protein [Segetibacter sp.]
MDKAVENFQLHQSEVAALKSNIQSLYTTESQRPKNLETIKMWDKMLDSTGNL